MPYCCTVPTRFTTDSVSDTRHTKTVYNYTKTIRTVFQLRLRFRFGLCPRCPVASETAAASPVCSTVGVRDKQHVETVFVLIHEGRITVCTHSTRKERIVALRLSWCGLPPAGERHYQPHDLVLLLAPCSALASCNSWRSSVATNSSSSSIVAFATEAVSFFVFGDCRVTVVDVLIVGFNCGPLLRGAFTAAVVAACCVALACLVAFAVPRVAFFSADTFDVAAADAVAFTDRCL